MRVEEAIDIESTFHSFGAMFLNKDGSQGGTLYES
jgi:hypothetical protein